MPVRRIKVLIVDDSAMVRKILTDGLAAFPDIEVVGTAMDPYLARDKILSLEPDVLTLDIEMPRMDGLSFLKLLMKHRPMPVIVISSLTTTGSAQALEALQTGAIDVMVKPDGSYSAQANCTELVNKIRAAFQARVRRPAPTPSAPSSSLAGGSVVSSALHRVASATAVADTGRLRTGSPRRYSPRQIILMGASTGGTEALRQILTDLSGDLPGICIVQHIPSRFSGAFAERLNSLCRLEVREARQGDHVEPGLALIAPGGYHMVLRRVTRGYQVDLNSGPQLHHQRPAVDVLFDSAAKAGAASHALALLLTGMGSDGAHGMLRLKEGGASTVAQDESSCVVFGMPREAIRIGAAQMILPLEQMSQFIEGHATDVALKASSTPQP